MDSFSWSDGVRAMLSSCLPCLVSPTPGASPAAEDAVRPSQYDELEGLLADSGDTDNEADAMSLHSNIGEPERRRRRRKKRSARDITLFGWSLFGRQAIALPDSDDEGAEGTTTTTTRGRRAPGQLSAASSSTLDSDAAPLDPTTIARLASPSKFEPAQTDAQLAEEEEEQRVREERQERKRERRELKRAARALALGLDDAEFEGFQGSGPLQRQPHSPLSSLYSPASHQPGEEFGPYVGAGEDADADADADALDFGAEVYTRRSRSGTSNGSDSQSRTSASASNSNGAYPQQGHSHHYISQAHMVPLPPTPTTNGPLAPVVDPVQKKTKKGKSSKSSKSTSSKKSSSSTSQSASLPSPVNDGFPAPDPQVLLPPSHLPSQERRSALEGLTQDAGSFPSVGFGGMRRKNSDMGAFLARRGDE